MHSSNSTLVVHSYTGEGVRTINFVFSSRSIFCLLFVLYLERISAFVGESFRGERVREKHTRTRTHTHRDAEKMSSSKTSGLIFTRASREALRDSSAATASVSMIGCLFILINALFLAPSTRRSRAARLVYALALADLGYCLAVVSFDTTKLESMENTTSIGCRAQGFFIQLFSMQTAMWSASMSHFTYSLVVKKKSGKETRDEKFYGAVILSVSFALSVLPFFRKNLYGDARIGKCHIKNDGSQLAVTARFLLFYLPIWVIMSMNTYMWVMIFKTLKTLRTFLMESNMNANVVVEEETEEEEDGDWAKVDVLEEEREEITSQAATKRAVKKAEKLVYALAAYPIIQIVTNIPGTFMRLENLFEYEKPDVAPFLAITHVVLKNLQGFFHALVFMFVHPNKAELVETLGRCFYCFVGNSRRRRNDTNSRWGGGIELAEEQGGDRLNTSSRELMPFEFERSDAQ